MLDLVVLTGGGHIADVRFRPETGFPTDNILWEAPWKSIDPDRFHARDATSYGPPFVGKFLAGFTGHALCLDFFGAPSPEEITQGLALHGEAPVSRWTIRENQTKTLSAAVGLPHAGLSLQRHIHTMPKESVIYFRETVENQRTVDRFFSWVQHATFGSPLLASGESAFFLSGSRAKTWALGYEGKPVLRDDAEFTWPRAPRLDGKRSDLRQPFSDRGKGFVATVRASEDREFGYVVVLNWRLGLAAGYVFRTTDFPWITLWEENQARSGEPWRGVTRARGVEFGTTPFPVGMRDIIRNGPLFDTPTLAVVGARAEKSTGYALFLTPVPRTWRTISDVAVKRNQIVLSGSRNDDRLILRASSLQTTLSNKPR